MKMRIEKDFMPFFLLVIVVLFFGLLAPASADFKKVNERELARANASVTGKLDTILCPDHEYANKELEEYDCVAIPAEKELVANEDSLSSVYTDYGYDWWKNRKVVGNLYYEDSSVLSALTVESGRDGDAIWVRIGLGSQEVELDSWDTNVTLGSSKVDSTTCCMNCFCHIHLNGLSVKTNGSSYVTLYKHDGQMGINVNVDATIDRISLATLSLGDCDGFRVSNSFGNDFTKAGYVGLKNTNIVGVTASGFLSISLAKIDNDIKSVHMGIDSMDVSMSSLDTTVVLGNKKDFSDTQYVLGTIYMKGLNMHVSGYLDIYNPTFNNAATTLGMGLNISSLTMDALAWGDSDGFGSMTGVGYRGWRNLSIKNLSIMGQTTFYENTVKDGDTGINLPPGTTYVNLDIINLNVSMGYMNRDVVLGNSKDNLNQVLRSVSWSNLSLEVNTGSIQIAPH
jgi:hypothetical protein